ncbi:unnamed protein product [Lactuca virosa]|uniref:Uncharacterized protein n=1 Tax=Lactuca virosa TaxID=75947 RepID=A0AAU9MMG4_9ASTR|nr:unnamed protein product [Lactuca virosa]
MAGGMVVLLELFRPASSPLHATEEQQHTHTNTTAGVKDVRSLAGPRCRWRQELRLTSAAAAEASSSAGGASAGRHRATTEEEEAAKGGTSGGDAVETAADRGFTGNRSVVGFGG